MSRSGGTRPRATPAVAASIGLLGFVLTVVWTANTPNAADREERRAELASIVEQRQARTDAYEQRLADLREQFAALAAESGEGQLAALRAATDRIAAVSGMTSLQGDGVIVTLSDAEGVPRSTIDSNFRILDVDLQAVINELWGAGAEAIAVNDQRVVSTTAVRNAGAAVLVNYKVLSSPYRVVALGDPTAIRAAFDASSIAAHFARWSDIYGLGFTIETSGDLQVPAYAGSLHFRSAHVIEQPSQEG